MLKLMIEENVLVDKDDHNWIDAKLEAHEKRFIVFSVLF
jgi:hypothetical protein